MANGNLIKLGTLYMGGSKQLRPTRPWRSDNVAPGGSGNGNIPNYSSGASLEIRDTDSSDAYKMQWIEVNDGNKKLLVGDRSALVNISWNDLNALGLITGKEIDIDGARYRLRVLTGGSNYRSGSDTYSGGTPTNNEWDRIITNEANFPGLPKPTSTDLDSSQNATDFNGEHNQLWNWFYCWSWCQEVYSGDSAYRTFRGYVSARYWGCGHAADRYAYSGWRPVLEVLNAVPLISDTDKNLGNKNSNFDITYQVNDSDASDVLTVIEKIDGATIRTITPAQRTYDYTISIDVNSLNLGTHTIVIECTDGKGGKATRTYTFTKTNAAPTISGKDENLGNKNLGFQVVYQVNDADGDEITVTERLNGVVLRTLSNPPKLSDITITLTDEQIRTLGLNSSNTITIEAEDPKGGIAYRTYAFKRVNTPPVITGIDENLGVISTPFTRDYIVTDAESDDVVVKELLNGRELKSYQVTLGTNNTTVFPREEFIKLENGTHTFEIKATDIAGTTTTRTLTFEKQENKILIQLKNPFETDAMVTKIFITPTWNTQNAKSVKVEACNNAFDESPTWENITDKVLESRHFNLTNITKTALKWGVNVRIEMIKDDMAGEIEITGFGGAFE